MSWYAGLVEGGGNPKGNSGKSGKKKDGNDGVVGEFELLVAKEGPKVVLERGEGRAGLGRGVGRGEEGEEVVERTFFQK